MERFPSDDGKGYYSLLSMMQMVNATTTLMKLHGA
jgi:hypothetical protein